MKFSGRVWVTMGRPDYIFAQFREIARCRDAQHGGGVCCAFAPQLVWSGFVVLVISHLSNVSVQQSYSRGH